ncbi:MAG TPA: ABC transporter substrate-binding protein, partial [Nitrospiria bacterium]
SLNLQNFINSYPDSPLMDQAYYGLARVNRLGEDNGGAVFYYEKLIGEFPDSPLLEAAELEMALAFIDMGNYDGAVPILERKRGMAQDREDRAFLTEQLVGVYLKKKDHVQAVVEMMRKAWPETIDRDLLREKISHTIGIARKDELKNIIKAFPGKYPGDQAILELAGRYESAGEGFEAEREFHRFTRLFPSHPSVPEVDSKLKGIKESYREYRFRVGALLPLSGTLEPFGREVLNGIRLAAQRHRESFPEENFLKVVVKDLEDEETGLLGGLDELAREYRVKAIIGPLLSRQVRSMGPRAERYKIPLVAPAAAADQPFTSEYLIRSSVTLRQQVRRIAAYAVNELDLPRFSVLFPDDRYGKEMNRLFTEEVARAGGMVMVSVSYPPDAHDFNAALRKLKKIDLSKEGTFEIPEEEEETGAETGVSIPVVEEPAAEGDPVPPPEEKPVYIPGFDAVFMPGDFDKVGLIAPHLEFHDIKGLPLLGTNGWNSPDLIRLGGRYIEGGIFVDGFFSASPEPEVKAFVEAYRERYREEPTILAAQAYDSARILFQAIEGGAEQGKDILQAIRETREFPGATGRIYYSSEGELARDLYIIQIRNGRFIRIN